MNPADEGSVLSAKRMTLAALGAFAISAVVVYLDVWLDNQTVNVLFFVAYWVLLSAIAICAVLAVTSIRKLAVLGPWPWLVSLGLLVGLFTFGISFILLVWLQFLFGGHS